MFLLVNLCHSKCHRPIKAYNYKKENNTQFDQITYSELWNIYNKNECQIWCVFGRRPCDSGNNWKCWLNQKFEIFNEQIKYLSRAIDNEFIYTFPNTIEEDWLVLHYQCISEYERNNALWEILLVYYLNGIELWFLFYSAMVFIPIYTHINAWLTWYPKEETIAKSWDVVYILWCFKIWNWYLWLQCSWKSWNEREI